MWPWQLGPGWGDRVGWRSGPWCPDPPCALVDRPWWWDALAWVLPILLVALLALLVAWVVTRLARPTPPAATSTSDAALEQARIRYARGEIDRETYLRLAGDLTGRPLVGGGTGG